MDKITTPLQALINSASKSTPSQSVTQALRRHQANPGGRTSFVLADVSGSMDEKAGAEKKIDLLRRALLQPGVDWISNTLVAFHSYPEPVSSPASLPDPVGSTALHRALDYIAPYRPKHTLIISDGHPDCKNAALKAAEKVTGVIDVLYIGPDNDRQAIDFMKKLAAASGGKIVINDVVKIESGRKQLAAQINKLLLR